MIDKELVTRKMLLIMEDLRAIEPLARKSRSEYLASATDEVLAERYLERIIGRMIDVNYHVLTESGEAPPRDYHESFTALAGIGALEAEFSRKLASTAGLRNRIVHEYDGIDPGLVHEALGTARQEIPLYLQGIGNFIEPS